MSNSPGQHEPLTVEHQLLVIGGGPAGLNAAKFAANAGLDVGLIDAGTRLGGQYWRHTGDENFDQGAHSNFDQGSLLIDAVKANPRITIYSSTSIWSASVIDGFVVLRAPNREFKAPKLIIATGAHDRTLPFPGWDLPGVMTPGALQSLFKGQKVIAGKKIVVAGSGPFLLPVASAIAKYGGDVVGVIEASSKYAWRTELFTLIRNPSKIVEGTKYLAQLRNSKVALRHNQVVISANPGADGTLASVTIADTNSGLKPVATYTVQCDVLAVGWGFVPDVSLPRLLDLTLKIGVDGLPVVDVDEHQKATSIHQGVEIYAAGETTGVGGYALALAEGAIAGLAAARSRSKFKELILLRRRGEQFAKALFNVYPIPKQWKSRLDPETIICRCEEVSYKSLMDAQSELGADDPRTAKLLTRVGMGMCQGRICSPIVCELLGASPEDIVRGNYRPVIYPITLGELSQEGLL